MGPATIGAIANFTRLALWAGVALSLWSGIAYLLAASRSDN
jgi:hypothetical protein